MAYSKIILNNEVLMDATVATASASDITAPKTAMLADGVMTIGTGTGGGGGEDKWSRPADWPDYSRINISEEECIFFTYDSSNDIPENFVAFQATCTNGYTVERGYLVNGIWTVENTYNISSNNIFSETLPIDRNYTIYKIKPTNNGKHITGIRMSNPSNYNGLTSGFGDLWQSQKLLERYGNLPYLTSLNSNWQNKFVISETQLSLASVTSLGSAWQGCRSLVNLDAKGVTNKLTSCSSAFNGCTSLKYLNVKDWNVSNVTSINDCFTGCSTIENIDISTWQTGQITSLHYMFEYCYNLKSINISKFDTSKVTNFVEVFYNCFSLKEIVGIENLDVSSATSFKSMFNGCSSLNKLDLSKWEPTKITTIENMFSGCTTLSSLNISKFDTSLVTSMKTCFNNCYSLKNIDINNFDYTSLTGTDSMFSSCKSLSNNLVVSLTRVDASTFQNIKTCDIIFDVETVPPLANTNAFSGNNFSNGQRIRFPATLVNTAKTASNWSTYAQYIEAIQE